MRRKHLFGVYEVKPFHCYKLPGNVQANCFAFPKSRLLCSKRQTPPKQNVNNESTMLDSAGYHFNQSRSSKKRLKLQNPIHKISKKPDFQQGSISEPYPHFTRPTPEECQDVRDRLLALHGFPEEFAKYRRQENEGSVLHPVPNDSDQNPVNPEHLAGDDGGFYRKNVSQAESHGESVLDGLVITLLSQNTTDANSRRAFASLKSVFPTWEDVLASEFKSIENAIKCGGLAQTKASCIKNILNTLLKEKGSLCLEYLRNMPVGKIKAELSRFKGIGPKTVACVLMFYLQRDDFPVDTHVFRVTKAIGWVPPGADREKAYLHLNQRIPDELKFDLNCLVVTHGKRCQRCAGKAHQPPKTSPHAPCPLTSYYDSCQ